MENLNLEIYLNNLLSNLTDEQRIQAADFFKVLTKNAKQKKPTKKDEQDLASLAVNIENMGYLVHILCDFYSKDADENELRTKILFKLNKVILSG
jgi:hypothetical protein